METTFVNIPSADERDFIESEVGDAKQEQFYPQVKVKRFSNEYNLSIRYNESGGTHSVEDGKVIWKKGLKEARFYEIEGAHEFEVIFNEKPVSNIVEFSIRHKNVDFYYQPELTDEEKEKGFERPENVIGSYAVYSSRLRKTIDGGKRYGCGKIAHIYRPKIIDKNGQEVWGDLNISKESNILTITIPQDFLDKAEYPVIVDPTIGYDVAGSSSVKGGSSDEAICSVFNTLTALSGDTVNQVSFYAKKEAANETVAVSLYTVSSTVPVTKVGTESSINVNSTTAQWWNASVSDVLSAGTEYGIAYGGWGGGVGSENTRIYYDSGASKQASYNTTTSLSSTWSESATFNLYFSIYASYTREPITIDYSYNIFINKAKL